MVLIFPNLRLRRRSLRSNLGGIDPEKLYRATLSFSSTQGSEMDGFAFEQIQGMKASATPAPKTSLILSSLGCVKFTCKTEAYVS